MVNAPANFRWVLLLSAIVLCLAAWSRGAEYDEQYTLFLTAGDPRPNWPDSVFPAGDVSAAQSGTSGLAAIGRDLRITDVHPPLYFWLVSGWRSVIGDSLFVARLFSVAAAVGALWLIGRAAVLAGVPAVPSVLLTLGCYGFTYTGAIARGFALAQLLLLAGVVCLLMERRPWRYGLAGLLFGAASFTNYLAVFVAAGCMACATTDAAWHRRPAGIRSAAGMILGFLVFIPADLWWFAAQKGSRDGQFPAFALIPAVTRLGGRFAGAVFGGLPIYAEGWLRLAIGGTIGLLAVGCCACVVWRWRATRARVIFAMAAAAPFAGLLLLGFVFNNAPFEVRYLAFSTPFVGLLLAGALPRPGLMAMLTAQAASIAGLMIAPATMQPMRAAAEAAHAMVGDGIVLLPRGNDGVGVVGAFAIESPPSLPLLLIRADATPARILAGIGAHRRVVLAMLEQDDASRAASAAMRRALDGPDWRETAHRGNVAAYERTGGGE